MCDATKERIRHMPSSCIVCCQVVSAFAFLRTGIHSLEVAVHSDQTVLLSLNNIKYLKVYHQQ